MLLKERIVSLGKRSWTDSYTHGYRGKCCL